MLVDKPKKLIILIALLLVVPAVISGFVWTTHGKTTVGIVLEEKLAPRFAEVAKDGFLLYEDYFEPIILEDRFNSSDVEIQGRYYLSKDFNDPEFSKRMRDKYDVQVILIITYHPIRNWIDNPYVAWGEASPKSASAVMTVYNHESDIARNRVHNMHTAVHEIAHLLGYVHDIWDPNSVMQYAGSGLNFTFYQSFELPYRVTFAPLGLEKDTWVAMFIMNGILALLFLPIVIAVVIAIRHIISKYNKFFTPTLINLVRDSCISFFILMVVANVVLGILFAFLLVFLFNIYIYLGAIIIKRMKTRS